MSRRQSPRFSSTCKSCRTGDCLNCTDVVRVALGREARCTCKRPAHKGEIYHEPPATVPCAVCDADTPQAELQPCPAPPDAVGDDRPWCRQCTLRYALMTTGKATIEHDGVTMTVDFTGDEASLTFDEIKQEGEENGDAV